MSESGSGISQLVVGYQLLPSRQRTSVSLHGTSIVTLLDNHVGCCFGRIHFFSKCLAMYRLPCYQFIFVKLPMSFFATDSFKVIRGSVVFCHERVTCKVYATVPSFSKSARWYPTSSGLKHSHFLSRCIRNGTAPMLPCPYPLSAFRVPSTVRSVSVALIHTAVEFPHGLSHHLG